jgi:cytoskeletal protein RodZ
MPFQPVDFQSHRIARGVSLQQIARDTMIGTRYLEAIERGAFHKLPGGVYTTSYIRQYARAAGCDETALMNYYREVSGATQSD